MKKTTLALLVLGLLIVSVIPSVSAADTGIGTGVDIETEDFEPLVWACDSRVVYDDNTEPGRPLGRMADGGCKIDEHWNYDYTEQSTCEANDGVWYPGELVERLNNYAFEGESISWNVLVMDKNGIQKISDVFGTVGTSQGAGNDIEVNCVESSYTGDSYGEIPAECNARILEEELREFDPLTQRFYDCTLTVETPGSMYGEFFLTVEAEDLDGLSGIMAENEFWFLNPVLALSIDGNLVFENVRPGTSSYSETILIGNDADDGSGVLMDMFISGTDFFDSSSSGAACPSTNKLSLGAFRYFATSGAYSTRDDGRADAEGYVPISYGIGFNNPSPFYGANEIIKAGPGGLDPYYGANILAPGAEHALTFRLNLPEPCNGDFDSGQIFFWGEAI